MVKSIFISCNLPSDNAHFQAVRQAIIDYNCLPHDHLYQDNGNQIKLRHRAIADSHYFIGIVALSYGKVLRDGKSAIELDYDEAAWLGRPRLMYLLHLLHDWHEDHIEFDTQAQLRLETFKNRIEQDQVIYDFFTTPQDLSKRVRRDLRALLNGFDVLAARRLAELPLRYLSPNTLKKS